jgi:hypothetical protein
MSCPVLLEPICVIGHGIGSGVGAVGGAVVADALTQLAHDIQQGVAWLVVNSITWWVKVPSPDLTADPVITALQGWLLPVTAAVAVFALMVSGIKMAVTAKANPLLSAGSGLITLAATTAVGVLLPTLLLRAGDAWSGWVLDTATHGQLGARLTQVLALEGVTAPAIVVVLGIVAIVVAAMQWALMLFRQGALVVLAGILPLAAAGTLTPATKPWFRRTTGWMLALIMYKPAAAAVYAVAFTMIGSGGAQDTMIGFAMIAMSLLALPVLMRFFTWTTGQVEQAAGGGGVLQTALSGAMAVGSLRGASGGLGAATAADQARQTSGRLGPADGGPAGAATTGTGVRQAAASSPGTGQPPGTAAPPASAPPAGGAGRPSPGTAAGPAPAAAGAAKGAGSTAGATSATSAAAAAGGPAAPAVTGLASGAAGAGRAASGAMAPPPGTKGQK